MASHIKRGELLFIPFRNDLSISDSQNKPRMYKTVQMFEKAFPKHHFHRDGVELVEYAEVRHAMWIQTEDVLGEEIDVCSWCKEEAVGYDTLSGGYMTEPTDYCPHCGAKMDMEEEK